MTQHLGHGSQYQSRARRKITLMEQLYLPLVPLVVDIIARILFLGEKLEWYLIPDTVAILVTFGFFNLGLMFSVRVPRIPADDEAALNCDAAKRVFLFSSILSICIASLLTGYRAYTEAFSETHVAEHKGLMILVSVCIYVAIMSIYSLPGTISYVGGGD